jgi:hypothetical protein
MAFAGGDRTGADALDAEPGDPGGEVGPVDAIAVVDQVAGVLAAWRGFDHLAPDPGSGRVTGHIEVEQAAAIVADQGEDERVWKVRVWTTNRSAAQMA